MIIVLAIIAMILGLGIPGFMRMKSKSHAKVCIINLKKIKVAADQFRLDNNINFTDAVNINSLWEASGKNVKKYILKKPICPVSGNVYLGSLTNSSNLYVTGNFRGGPFCARSGQIYGKSTDYPHYEPFSDKDWLI